MSERTPFLQEQVDLDHRDPRPAGRAGRRGTWIYINFIEGDPPAKLKLSDVSTTKPNNATSSTKPSDASIDGDWTVASGSKVQYRAGEVLFGQSTTAWARRTRSRAT